jgi:hypothetical protein
MSSILPNYSSSTFSLKNPSNLKAYRPLKPFYWIVNLWLDCALLFLGATVIGRSPGFKQSTSWCPHYEGCQPWLLTLQYPRHRRIWLCSTNDTRFCLVIHINDTTFYMIVHIYCLHFTLSACVVSMTTPILTPRHEWHRWFRLGDVDSPVDSPTNQIFLPQQKMHHRLPK